MVIGKDVAMGPTAVKASSVTATSAVISWLPSNSNHQHVVCVNNVEVRTVKPGVYRHTITGLAPSTIYRVTVKAKNLRATHFEDQNAQSASNQACHVHFKTLPKGLPDPPVDIQVKLVIFLKTKQKYQQKTQINKMSSFFRPEKIRPEEVKGWIVIEVFILGGGWTAGRHFASDLAACCPTRFRRHRLRGLRRWQEGHRRRQPDRRPCPGRHPQTHGAQPETHHRSNQKQGKSIGRQLRYSHTQCTQGRVTVTRPPASSTSPYDRPGHDARRSQQAQAWPYGSEVPERPGTCPYETQGWRSWPNHHWDWREPLRQGDLSWIADGWVHLLLLDVSWIFSTSNVFSSLNSSLSLFLFYIFVVLYLTQFLWQYF